MPAGTVLRAVTAVNHPPSPTVHRWARRRSPRYPRLLPWLA